MRTLTPVRSFPMTLRVRDGPPVAFPGADIRSPIAVQVDMMVAASKAVIISNSSGVEIQEPRQDIQHGVPRETQPKGTYTSCADGGCDVVRLLQNTRLSGRRGRKFVEYGGSLVLS